MWIGSNELWNTALITRRITNDADTKSVSCRHWRRTSAILIVRVREQSRVIDRLLDFAYLLTRLLAIICVCPDRHTSGVKLSLSVELIAAQRCHLVSRIVEAFNLIRLLG
jgi:hypothetical protein